MSLIRFNNHRLFPDFSNLVNHFFEDSSNNSNKSASFIPSVNISEDEEVFKLEVAAPGLKKENFNLDLHKNILTISTNKEVENEEAKESVKYTRREFSYHSFERSFTLPNSVKQEDIRANYENGILNIALPKKESTKPVVARQISIS